MQKAVLLKPNEPEKGVLQPRSFDLKSKTANLKNGMTLSFYDEGERNHPCICFVHGFPDLAYGWRYQIEHFKKSYRVIAPDMRGYGGSSKPEEKNAYQMKELVNDIVLLLEHLDIKKADLVGHDWGVKFSK